MNEAPELTLPGPVSAQKQESVPISGLAFSDEANTTTVGAAVSVNVGVLNTTASVGNGTITTGSLKVEAGTPEMLAQISESYTGRFLKKVLE